MSRSVRGLLAGVGVALLCGACAPAPASPAPAALSPRAAVDELLAADRAFSAASARTDLVTGLAALFADNVLMPVPGGRFAEGAAQAVEALRANPANAGARAEWTPVRGGVSADGRQGFTFGYMTLRRADGTEAPLKYMAYWEKRPEGWRAVAYKRSARPAGPVSLDPMPPSLPARMVRPAADPAVVERHRASLDSAERAFSDTAQVIGLGPAFVRFGSPDAVNMGGGSSAAYVVGAEAIGQLVGRGGPPTGSPVVWAPDRRVIVASSGDLGVTLGTIRPSGAPPPGAPAGQPFFTIWRRASPSEHWRYVAE